MRCYQVAAVVLLLGYPSASAETSNSSNPDFAKTCIDFGNQYRATNEEYDPSCRCEERHDDLIAVCWEDCERCLDNGSLCAFRGYSNLYKFSNDYSGSWTRYDFKKDGGDWVRLSMWSSPNDASGNPCYLNIDDEPCKSCTFNTCGVGGRLGFVADCSNRGYGNINSCEGTTTFEEFRHFFGGASNFSPRDCNPGTSKNQESQSTCKNSYNKLREGQISYGMNDGGCFFCSTKAFGSDIPLSGDTLSDECQQMCDSDPDCISFEVGRAATLPVWEYYFGGEKSNCCLQRKRYSDQVFVDTTNKVGTLNGCQKEALCWTRFEKLTLDSSSMISLEQCGEDEHPPPSKLCSVVLKPVDDGFSIEDTQRQIDFIAQGCQWNDTELSARVDKAYDLCKDEIESKSNSSSVVVSYLGYILTGVLGVLVSGW